MTTAILDLRESPGTRYSSSDVHDVHRELLRGGGGGGRGVGEWNGDGMAEQSAEHHPKS